MEAFSYNDICWKDNRVKQNAQQVPETTVSFRKLKNQVNYFKFGSDQY